MNICTINAAALATAILLAPAVAPAQSSGAFSFGKPKAEAAETVEVTAKGQGETVEAAKKDAVRNAIKKAVGELVGAKTLVENDELVEDKILTLSNAMVEKAEYGDAKSIGDGLFEVPVKALVKKGQLNQELTKVGIATGAVKGDSLAAKLFTGKERIANAEKFLAERFRGFPGDIVEAVMKAKEDGSPDIEVDQKTGHVFANVELRVNMENYAKWTQALCEVLEQICLEKEDITLKFNISAGRYVMDAAGKSYREDNALGSEKIRLKQYSPKQIFPLSEQSKYKSFGSFPVVVATPSPGKELRTSWPATIYYMDSQMWEALDKAIEAELAISGAVHTMLKDKDGEAVCSDDIKLGGRGTGRYYSGEVNYRKQLREGRYGVPISFLFRGYNAFDRDGLCLIAPAIRTRVFRSGNDFAIERYKQLESGYRCDLGEVSEDDLASVASYEVKVEYKYPGQN
jgi:hypothetical protein